jgi:hypothetical protein
VEQLTIFWRSWSVKIYLTFPMMVIEQNGTVNLTYCQGRRNDVKARVADFRERALLNWYILRDVCKTSGVELFLIMFSIYWIIGVWGGSPPDDCAILEARWLHFLRFLKQIRKRIALTFLTIAISPRQSFKLKGIFAEAAAPPAPPAPPPQPVPASLPIATNNIGNF